MRVGLDRLPHLQPLMGRLRAAPFGLLAHPASVDASLRHISDILPALGLRASIVFGPEHGYGGEAQDMVGVADAVDARWGVPIVSLYGKRIEDLSPRAEHLSGLRTLLIDLADVGSRYYTFVWTALLAVRAAAAARVQCVVLDRPNPLGGLVHQVEGAPQQADHCSLVGLEPIPVRHALTIGELIADIATREGLTVGPDDALQVVPVEQWCRADLACRWDRAFVSPSPNMPTADTALVYPGGCLLEGTNLSEGRGTTRPFEVFGAPWLDGRALADRLANTGLEGFVARPVTFRPMFHKHAGAACGGVQIHVTNPARLRPMATYLAAIALTRELCPQDFAFRTEPYEFVSDKPAFDLLIGNAAVREAIVAGMGVEQLLELGCSVPQSYAEQHARAVARVGL